MMVYKLRLYSAYHKPRPGPRVHFWTGIANHGGDGENQAYRWAAAVLRAAGRFGPGDDRLIHVYSDRREPSDPRFLALVLAGRPLVMCNDPTFWWIYNPLDPRPNWEQRDE